MGPRVVCWFSCGATSAVATKIAIDKFRAMDVHVVYIDPGSEHPDNARFLRDCSAWFGLPVEVIRSSAYSDTWDVFARTRWLVGPQGARCSTELKKIPRREYQRPDDIQVFGFDTAEFERADRFREQNPEVDLRCPLQDAGLSKGDCLALLGRAGIQVPAMYALGFSNANCVGCVKGGMGYWNRIRRTFPDTFARMAALERTIGAAICRVDRDGEKVPVYLDELDPAAGKDDPPLAECSIMCAATESALRKGRKGGGR